jgi:hypothetical protein
VSELPILRIRTNHSEYLVNQNTGEFSRRTVHESANSIPNLSSGEWHPYSDLYYEIGAPLVIVQANGFGLRSTRVQSVEEIANVA